MIWKKQEASITVEAAFLIPIVIFVIMALIYLTFYLHDRIRLEEVMEGALSQGNFHVSNRSGLDGIPFSYADINKSENWGYIHNSYERSEIQILEVLKEEMKTGFFFLKEKSVSCDIDGFFIKIKIEMESPVSLNPLENFWKKKKKVVLERKIALHNPEEVLRAYEGLQFIIDDVSSFTFVKKHIEKLRNTVENSLK